MNSFTIRVNGVTVAPGDLPIVVVSIYEPVLITAQFDNMTGMTYDLAYVIATPAAFQLQPQVSYYPPNAIISTKLAGQTNSAQLLPKQSLIGSGYFIQPQAVGRVSHLIFNLAAFAAYNPTPLVSQIIGVKLQGFDPSAMPRKPGPVGVNS